MSRRVLVVGAGVSGLTAAYRLHRDGVEVIVLETAEQVGGRIGSMEVGGVRVETGPDSFLARKPWAVELSNELGVLLVPPGCERCVAVDRTGLGALSERHAVRDPGRRDGRVAVAGALESRAPPGTA